MPSRSLYQPPHKYESSILIDGYLSVTEHDLSQGDHATIPGPPVNQPHQSPEDHKPSQLPLPVSSQLSRFADGLPIVPGTVTIH